jgi:anti-sigma28 factor (negative regulator of flagellin synthesis)
MKVNDGNLNGVNHSRIGGLGGADRTQMDRTSRGGGSADRRVDGSNDRVQLSDLGRQLRMANEGTPERAVRLEQLRADVQSGRYQPDAREVSQSIIKDALSGLG